MAKTYFLDENGLIRLSEDIEYRHPSTFTGTRAEWEALPEARKVLYKYVNFTDDDSDFIGLRHPTVYIGTREEWAAVPIDEKKKYQLVCLTNDLAGIGWYLSNKVEEGDMNPVTSNAVAEAIHDMNSVYITGEILIDFDGTTSATYTDNKITADTIITVYYTDPSVAEAAEISAYPGNGVVTFTAVTAPANKVACRLSCLLPTV